MVVMLACELWASFFNVVGFVIVLLVSVLGTAVIAFLVKDDVIPWVIRWRAKRKWQRAR